MGTQIWGKVHNFGIYRKGGKRCILQLDFPGRSMLIIQKGHIKKTHSFDALQHYDSEEGLHVSLKFLDGEIDFEADNTEEKYTICRLLGLVLTSGSGEDVESIDSGQGLSSLGDHHGDSGEVIKEGLLEKKGNTTITTWNKRRVRLIPGEFSYFKPGEELALNVVQLWPETCEVKKTGLNGFSVSVRDRVYSFRVSSEYKAMNMTEIVRDEWFVAFEQALNQVSPMAKIFDQPLSGNGAVDSEPIYDVTPDMMGDSSSNTAHNRMQLLEKKHSQGEITTHVTVHVNYIDKGMPVPHLATFGRSRSSDDLLSATQNESKTLEESTPYSVARRQSSESKDPFMGSAADFKAKLAMKGGKSSSLKAYRAQQDFKSKHGSKGSGKAKLKGVCSEEKIQQIHRLMAKEEKQPSDNKTNGQIPLKKSNSDSLDEKRYPSVIANNMSTSHEIPERIRVMPPPPLPPTAHSGAVTPGAPPLPPGGPPPPPPLGKSGNLVKLQHTPNVKLKQVHWVKINNNQINSSMWKDARDLTSMLDLTELEEQFSIQEKKCLTVKPKPQEDKQMLIDTKRAQNLGILFSGLKLDSLTKLTDALNSTVEVDSFPADKMSTLKRYQPTTEDKEMYKLYTDKRDTLHAVDRFMLELCEIPRLSLRLDLSLTLWEFPDQYASLEEEVNDLLSGCDEILTSTALTTILEYLLAIGNYMNSLWNAKQGAKGFHLTSIEKVLSVKGRDSQIDLCTYLVKQIKTNQPELLSWPKSLAHVTKCTGYSVKAVGAEIDVLKNDLQKIKKTLKTLRGHNNTEDKSDKQFQLDVQNFIVEYDRKMDQMDGKYTKVTDKYKQMMVRFGEVPNKTTESLFASVSLFMEKFQQATEKVK